MKFSVVLFSVCLLVISVSGDSAEKTGVVEGVVIDKPDVPPEPEKNETTPAPTPTPAPPTTTPPTTTKPTTTTEKTTTTPATTTSTVAPTPPAPTPAPTPGPAPAPTTGTWVVNGTNHTTCIMVKMAAQLNVTYLNKDNKTMHQLITLPNNTMSNATGDCGAAEQYIMISWNSSMALNDTVVLHFNKNGTKYSLHHVEANLAPQDLPSYQFKDTLMMIHNTSEYPVAVSNSYRCTKAVKLNLNSNVPNTTAVFEVSDLQFQAFRSDNTTAFGFAEDCAFETQDVVPIAVGCALIALVIIVLIAYLVGRRRSQARGYLSM
ncbi:lysosome-associated membrane glycoprotein 1-like isoform X2 [Cotesia glomerata]|uniref:lysosome-associated membrane glycoprotein 1-like isoform X2 n=1 Tax=Cotesia glomerata TaxID=32391 RepID=UPI001D00C690|nr:lysosome-associated membrane glycoprotein 1-like isoform X2 [Cotesia glomerata]